MIILKKKKIIFSIVKVIFDASEDLRNIIKADIINVFYSDYPPKESLFLYKSTTYTARIDLQQSIDNIRDYFTKTIRNEISRAKREGVNVKVYLPKEIASSHSLVDYFLCEYKKFCKIEKYSKIVNYFDSDEILKLAEQNNVYITEASFNDGKVFHIYYCDEKNTMLKFSFFSNKENTDKNVIGRANKYLHYYDICMFKNIGLINYDWGGIFDINNPNGIDKFKLSFGPTTYVVYCYYQGKTILGKLIVLVFKIIKNLL